MTKKYFEIKTRIDYEHYLNTEAIPRRKAIEINGVKDPFIIEFKPLKKTKSYPQLKGFHLLCNMMLPYFRDYGYIWNLDKVKDFIKKRADYTEKFKGIEVVKSCKDASLEDMKILIMEAERFGSEMDWEGIVLEDKYLRELENWYNNKEKKCL